MIFCCATNWEGRRVASANAAELSDIPAAFVDGRPALGKSRAFGHSTSRMGRLCCQGQFDLAAAVFTHCRDHPEASAEAS
jgi:hypothetical protein